MNTYPIVTEFSFSGRAVYSRSFISTHDMRITLTILLLYPLLLAAQCFGSFETFAAAGFSGMNYSPKTDGPAYQPVSVVRAGFGASFAVGRQLLLRTGLQLSQYGDNRKFDGLRWGSQTNGSGGFDPTIPSPVGQGVWRPNRYLYFEGLLALRYEFRSRRKLRPFVEGGMALGSYVTNIYQNFEGERDTYVRDNTRKISSVVRLGGGVNYLLNDNLGVYAMPVGQYTLSSLNADGPSTVRAWQVTLEVGVRVFVDPR